MSKVNDTSAGFPSENIPDDGDNKIWPEMEADGVVFLPAAGFRNGYYGDAIVSNVGDFGFYWSASPSAGDLAYDLRFRGDDFNPINFDARYSAQSVRLVTECQ